MKVVIDPNVVGSAALKIKDPEAVLRAVVAHADWEWIVPAEILAEYKAVLAREKFGLPPELLCQWITFLETVTVLVDVPVVLSYPPDPADAKFLGCTPSGS
jgi:predicted nucleic acid-binding protein